MDANKFRNIINQIDSAITKILSDNNVETKNAGLVWSLVYNNEDGSNENSNFIAGNFALSKAAILNLLGKIKQ